MCFTSLSSLAREPLWWNDACYHALVARNGSWRDFRRSGSHEDQARFRLLRQQFHSTIRSSRTHYWNEWLGSVTSLSRQAPRLACSLVRRTFRSSVVTPDLCHVQWDGASRCALPPDEARSHWRAHFSSSTEDTRFSDDICASRLSRPCTILGDLMLPLPRVSSWCGRDGVIFRSPSSSSSCASPWSHPLSSSRSSSATVTPPPLIPIVLFLSHLALSNFSST